MSSHHVNLRVRFYPAHGEWTCVVQRMGGDGMPLEGDVVAAIGKTKDEARANAQAQAQDADVRDALSPDAVH
jgi:hypothetical protein